MRTLLLGLVTAATLLPAALAHADQCAWMTEQQAIEGAKKLAPSFGDQALSYCEPCNDTEAVPKTVRGVAFSAVRDQPEYYQVKLNGVPTDIAYLYVPVDTNADGKTDVYKNLAALAGCPVTDVSLEFAPGDVKIGDKADDATGDGTADDEGAGGCSTTGSTSPMWLVGLGLAFAMRRRRR